MYRDQMIASNPRYIESVTSKANPVTEERVTASVNVYIFTLDVYQFW